MRITTSSTLTLSDSTKDEVTIYKDGEDVLNASSLSIANAESANTQPVAKRKYTRKVQAE